MEFPELPDWTFQVEEVSFGVFVVSGRDVQGRSVVKSGRDPDALLELCRSEAPQLSIPRDAIGLQARQ